MSTRRRRFRKECLILSNPASIPLPSAARLPAFEICRNVHFQESFKISHFPTANTSKHQTSNHGRGYKLMMKDKYLTRKRKTYNGKIPYSSESWNRAGWSCCFLRWAWWVGGIFGGSGRVGAWLLASLCEPTFARLSNCCCFCCCCYCQSQIRTFLSKQMKPKPLESLQIAANISSSQTSPPPSSTSPTEKLLPLLPTPSSLEKPTAKGSARVEGDQSSHHTIENINFRAAKTLKSSLAF